MIESVAFLIVASITLGSALAVVLSRTVFVSALWLILTFVGVAGLYALMGASFLAVTQILIYVGAISVLLIFAIMLTHDAMGEERPLNRQWPVATMVALGLFTVLGIAMFRADWPLSEASLVPVDGGLITDESGVVVAASDSNAPAYAIEETNPSTEAGTPKNVARIPDTVTAIGRSLMTEHLLAFEVISIVLLVALMGAIVIARD